MALRRRRKQQGPSFVSVSPDLGLDPADLAEARLKDLYVQGEIEANELERKLVDVQARRDQRARQRAKSAERAARPMTENAKRALESATSGPPKRCSVCKARMERNAGLVCDHCLRQERLRQLESEPRPGFVVGGVVVDQFPEDDGDSGLLDGSELF